MKVLFINPSRAGQGNIPLNIPLLIGVLKGKGHDVRLFDLSDYDVFNDKSYEKLFFKQVDFNDDKVIADRLRFYGEEFGKHVTGTSLKSSSHTNDFQEMLKEFQPDIVAVSALSTDAKFAQEFLLPFKEAYGFSVVFGGIHAILLPDETIGFPSCDYICTGEGENALIALLSALEEGKPLESVNGIWFKKDGVVVKNRPVMLTELVKLPLPDFSLFDPIHFHRPFDGKRYKMINYELSRGCPYNCTYCVNGILKEKYRGLGKYHRVKEVRQGIRELKELVQTYGFEFVRFWDEDFTALRSEFLEEFAGLYIKEINLPFIVYARVESVTDKKTQLLKDMGCRTFAMGIESGNEFIRKNVMNRKMSNRMIIEKFALVKSYGIRVSAYNMIGLPRETREMIFDTIELNKTIQPDSFSVTLLEPYKGTPIRVLCERDGLDPRHEAIYNPTTPQFVPAGMTGEELAGLFRTFPLYIRLPRQRYDEIKEAERDDTVYAKLLKEQIL